MSYGYFLASVSVVVVALSLNASNAPSSRAQSSTQSGQTSTQRPSSQGEMGPNMMQQHMNEMGQMMMGPGMMIPPMNSAHGRKVFANKGCVVCHAVNGIGGHDAPPLDASTMPKRMSPFEFFAKMWRGSEAMNAMAKEELGSPIQFTGDEIEDVIAFVHDEAEQRKFTAADIPAKIKAILEKGGEEPPGGSEQGGSQMNMEKPK